MFFVGVDATSRSELMRIKSTGDVNVANDIFSEGLYVNSNSAVSGTQVAIVKDGEQNLQRWGTSSDGTTEDSYRFRIDQNMKFIANSGSGDTLTIFSDTGNIQTSGTLTTQGVDGGAVIRNWTGNTDYVMWGTSNMSGSEYAILTDGSSTFLSGGVGGSVHIRGGNNTNTHQLVIGDTGARFYDDLTIDNNLIVGDNTLNNQGVRIYSSNATDGYGVVRFYHGSTNINTIHSFGEYWQSGTIYGHATDTLNLDGSAGVTIGPWNDIDAAFVEGGTNYFKRSIGIGQTTPTSSLHITQSIPSITLETSANANDPIINLKSNQAISGEGAQIWYDNSQGDLHIQTTYADAAADIKFHTATGADKGTGNLRMVIGGDGNVGIGGTITAPEHKLVVGGNIGFGDGTYNGGVYSRNTSTDGGVDENWGLEVQRTSGIDDYNTRLKYYPTNGTSRKAGIWNSRDDKFSIYSNDDTEPDVIIPYGLLGVGSTNPGRGITIDKSNEFAALEIIKNNSGNQIVYLGTGSSGAGENAILQLKEGTVEKIRLYATGDSWINGGNVGIGTDTPDARLHIEHNDNNPLKLENTTGVIVKAQFEDNASRQAEIALHTGAITFSNGTSGVTERMRIDTSGVVSVATGNLRLDGTAKLYTNNDDLTISADDNGNGSSGRIMFRTANGERLKIDSGGNFQASVNADTNYEFGRVHLNYIGHADHAGFSHIDQNSTTSYALLQNASGQTYLNAPSGQDLRFRINNNDVGVFDGTSFNFGVGTTTPDSYMSGTKGISIVNANYAALGLSNGTTHWLTYLTTNADRYRIWNSVSNEVMTILSGGNVGIANDGPNHLFELGNSNSLTISGTYEMFSAGAFGVLFRNSYDCYITGNTQYTSSGWVNKYGGRKSSLIGLPDGQIEFNIGTGTTQGGASNLTVKSNTTINGTTFFVPAQGSGSGDRTNVQYYPYKVDSDTQSSDYWRIPHLSGHPTVAGVYNYETGKNVYWGEPSDTGSYEFRGRYINATSSITTVGAFHNDLTSCQFKIGDTSNSSYSDLI